MFEGVSVSVCVGVCAAACFLSLLYADRRMRLYSAYFCLYHTQLSASASAVSSGFPLNLCERQGKTRQDNEQNKAGKILRRVRNSLTSLCNVCVGVCI